MEFDKAVAELEALVETLEREGDERALLLLQLVDAIHRPALERIAAGDTDHPMAQALLQMYDIASPDDEVLVEEALDEVRPYIHSHGGEVKLLAVSDGVVELRMSGSCAGCAASAMTLKRGVEEALRKHYPGFKEVVAEEPEGAPAPQLLQIENLRRPVFVDAGEASTLDSGEVKATKLDGIELLLANLDGEIYALPRRLPDRRPHARRVSALRRGSTGLPLAQLRLRHPHRRPARRRGGRGVEGDPRRDAERKRASGGERRVNSRVLVGCVGNVLRGDDGFGPAVAARLTGLPEGAEVVETGIGGIALLQELLAGCDGLVLIDAVDRGEEPGTVFVIEPEVLDGDHIPDVHLANPERVLTMAKAMGVLPDRVLIVGCQPAEVDKLEQGLSPAVARAVAVAAARVEVAVGDWVAEPLRAK